MKIIKKDRKAISAKIDAYKEDILLKNYTNFKSFTFGGMILTGIISIIAMVFQKRVFFNIEYCFCFVYFVLCYLFTKLILNKNIKYTLAVFYIALIPIYAVGILMGTFLDPENGAMTIIVLLCTLFMFITDKPQRIIGYVLGISAVFLFCSYITKTLDLFVADFVNLTIYLSIGLSVNMLNLSDRIDTIESQNLLRKKAEIDNLTGLLNRGTGENAVKDLLNKGHRGSFMIIDIDEFKSINDTYGHQVGDAAICAVAQKLKTTFRDTEVVLRLGGDEFAVFAIDLCCRETCRALMKKIQTELKNVRVSDTKVLEIKISIGCSIVLTEGYEFEHVYKASDDALYEAKQKGKNRFIIREI